LKNCKGFTLVETLIGMALMAFVTVAILGTFTQVQLNTQYVGDKNLALMLTESKMEELIKYPGSKLTMGTTIDYAVKTANSFYTQSGDPDIKNQFRRTATITADGGLMNILVTVEYGKSGSTYAGRVSLNSRRGG
jgi:type II secretory pathway pseudopilin PulG